MSTTSFIPYAVTVIFLTLGAFLPQRSAAEPAAVSEPLTEAERTAFQAELQPLQNRLAELRKAPDISPDHWADAQIFLKGVDWALKFGPVSDVQTRALIKRSLERARERIDALAVGRHPWSERRGRVARAFISAVDGSVQPYGLVVPEGYDPAKPIRLDVFLHGSSPVIGTAEMTMLSNYDAGDVGTDTAPATLYIELVPLGRLGENAYRFEGETDVFEAIESVCRNYNVDRSRIVLRGGSLGGSGTWQIGLKRPDRFVVLGPLSGPVDTVECSRSPREDFIRLDPLTPCEQSMLHLVDAVDYAANAGMVPVVCAMGDKDFFYSSHLLIEKAFAKERIPFIGLVDYGAGHAITIEVYQRQLDLVGGLATRKLDPFPKHIRFVTWTLKFSRCYWIEVLGLVEHYQRAEIEARIGDDGAITLAEPRNITRFAMHPPAIRSEGGTVVIAGARISLPASPSGTASPLVFEKLDGTWTCRGTLDSVPLTGKRPGLQGPIDDAFARSFLCVRGTGKAWNPAVANWADANLRRFAEEWQRHYRGYLPIKNDTEVTDDDVRRSNLILFGDPGSNLWIGKVLPQLPIQWNRETLQVGAENHTASDHGMELIYPNPLPGAEQHYLVLNSGHTYHEAELRSSYMVFPRLGDWAVMKVGNNSASSPAPSVAETVVNSGFFNEAWTISPSR